MTFMLGKNLELFNRAQRNWEKKQARKEAAYGGFNRHFGDN